MPYLDRVGSNKSLRRVPHSPRLCLMRWVVFCFSRPEGAWGFSPTKNAPWKQRALARALPRERNFPQKPQQIRMSSPSMPENPHNQHRINHFPPKNSWHSSYAPTRRIKVVENKSSPTICFWRTIRAHPICFDNFIVNSFILTTLAAHQPDRSFKINQLHPKYPREGGGGRGRTNNEQMANNRQR